MLFARLAVFALPFLGAFASPIASPDKDVVEVEKRDSLINVVTNLQNNVQGPLALLNAANGDKVLTADDAQVYLTDILNCINIANQALGSVGNEARGLSGLVETIKLEARGEQVEEVAEVLAKVIGDIVTAVEDIVDNIKYLPVVGILIGSIDAGLDTLLVGLELVLAGVVEVVSGLLGGVKGLLGSLGFGLLGGE
ncbi:hypothetical protein DB88DRAFT_46827 [Papiliotrema laurentii]|uniref:Uncharacterized protein n=1 Tax=Papiliotrema laurentii TaxID=5418 RepID=A0AAD9FWW6_PAPLA|nr:hypothetical protein DB88DRAFT_46827 [Papiliotrema laurentii]